MTATHDVRDRLPEGMIPTAVAPDPDWVCDFVYVEGTRVFLRADAFYGEQQDRPAIVESVGPTDPRTGTATLDVRPLGGPKQPVLKVSTSAVYPVRWRAYVSTPLGQWQPSSRQLPTAVEAFLGPEASGLSGDGWTLRAAPVNRLVAACRPVLLDPSKAKLERAGALLEECRDALRESLPTERKVRTVKRLVSLASAPAWVLLFGVLGVIGFNLFPQLSVGVVLTLCLAAGAAAALLGLRVSERAVLVHQLRWVDVNARQLRDEAEAEWSFVAPCAVLSLASIADATGPDTENINRDEARRVVLDVVESHQEIQEHIRALDEIIPEEWGLDEASLAALAKDGDEDAQALMAGIERHWDEMEAAEMAAASAEQELVDLARESRAVERRSRLAGRRVELEARGLL